MHFLCSKYANTRYTRRYSERKEEEGGYVCIHGSRQSRGTQQKKMKEVAKESHSYTPLRAGGGGGHPVVPGERPAFIPDAPPTEYAAPTASALARDKKRRGHGSQ
jgi:hypothetical protein